MSAGELLGRASEIKYAKAFREEVAEARSRFYPGYRPLGTLERHPKPFFRVMVSTDRDFRLAQLAQPEGAEVEIIHTRAYSLSLPRFDS